MTFVPVLTTQAFKRSYLDGGSWTGGARWAFFAIFLVLIIIVVLGTMRVNRARSRQGVQPIYGTRWMTPPSYFQSQGQYNQPTQRDPDMPNAYVPTYTATANEYDMGYYDATGNYHANPNAKEPAIPDPVHQRTTSNADGIPLGNYDYTGTSHPATVTDEHNETFRRPTGPPPTANTTGSTDPLYDRPLNPPPQRTS